MNTTHNTAWHLLFVVGHFGEQLNNDPKREQERASIPVNRRAHHDHLSPVNDERSGESRNENEN